MNSKPRHSPRRIDFGHEALQAIALDDKEPPPEDSIAWKLWLACEDIARDALHSDYVQGMKRGSLDPRHYGRYTLQDAVYCHHGQDDYRALETRASLDGHPTLAAFAKARYDSYAAYNAETFAAWHIADADALTLADAARVYVDFEHRIATGQEPIYGVLAMIPCNQLWAHLATELEPHAGAGNLYSFWITDNAGWGGAYRLDNFIDQWFAEHREVYDCQTALFVYQSCMTCEANFFRSACGQELLPMPERVGSRRAAVDR